VNATTANDRADALARQRESLRNRCSLQRGQLAQSVAEIERQLGGIDRAVQLVRGIASKPTLITAGVAALTLLGPKKAVRWISQGAFWYATGKRLAQVVSATGIVQRYFPIDESLRPSIPRKSRASGLRNKLRISGSRHGRLLPEKS
jgi:hypothetical protein